MTSTTARRVEMQGDWGSRSDDMPDMCHDVCVKAGDFDHMYYPFRWEAGRAYYQCRAGHRWTCGWGHTYTGSDPASRGRDRAEVAT